LELTGCAVCREPCGEMGECENLVGSYECMCQPGYSFSGISPHNQHHDIKARLYENIYIF
jgi:hypothetical protein